MRLLTKQYRVVSSVGGKSEIFEMMDECIKPFIHWVRVIDGSSAPEKPGFWNLFGRTYQHPDGWVVIQKFHDTRAGSGWMNEAEATMVEPGKWVADETGTKLLKEYYKESREEKD